MEDRIVSDLIRDMIEINRIHKSLIDARTSGLGIGRTQHILLMHLANREKCGAQKELAEHLRVTPAAVTESLHKLERDGFIDRKNGNDNRTNEIRITERGREAVDLTRAIFSDVDEKAFAGFSESEIQTFSGLLAKLKNNLIKEREDDGII